METFAVAEEADSHYDSPTSKAAGLSIEDPEISSDFKRPPY